MTKKRSESNTGTENGFPIILWRWFVIVIWHLGKRAENGNADGKEIEWVFLRSVFTEKCASSKVQMVCLILLYRTRSWLTNLPPKSLSSPSSCVCESTQPKILHKWETMWNSVIRRHNVLLLVGINHTGGWHYYGCDLLTCALLAHATSQKFYSTKCLLYIVYNVGPTQQTWILLVVCCSLLIGGAPFF